MNSAYLSIGTNIGERLENLQHAIRLLQQHEAITVTTVSAVYETAAVGFTDQADFLNIAVHITTTLSAQDLLLACQQIENDLGRVREFRWGPRIIDLDILLYNNENIDTENLTLPHPRMFERAFVIVPLMDVMVDDSSQLQHAREQFMQIDASAEGVVAWQRQQDVKAWL